jgi:G6PDH family F420-dependent oxidoreductase
MSPAFGYTLSSEEHPPRDLVANARRAEAAGFDFCSISDHYHPWIDAQGHSPFVWGVLGAVAEATDRIEVGVGVSCPTVRIHPAVLAQAAATTAHLLEGRFVLGVGTGELLNEHVVGHRWPPAGVRLAMLEEAVAVMRRLWTGDRVDHRGDFYEVEDARLYDPPPGELPVIVSAFGPEAAALAARIGDGLWSTSPDDELLDRYGAEGGTGPRYGQIDVCYGADEADSRRTVAEQWPNAGFPGQLAQDTRSPALFDQLAEQLTEDQAVGPVPCGPDLDGICAAVRHYLDAGFDHVHLHQIGPDQEAFLDVWDRELGDAVRTLTR